MTKNSWRKPGDICPWCGGKGKVFSIVDDSEISCRLCGGEGTWDGEVVQPNVQPSVRNPDQG